MSEIQYTDGLVDSDGVLHIFVPPVATGDRLGGVMADPATEADTIPACIGEDGKLYVAAVTDTTLSVAGIAADAAAVGRLLAGKADACIRTTDPLECAEVYAEEGSPIYLRIDIQPRQEGEGDPSLTNVRPIVGWERILLTVGGADAQTNPDNRVTCAIELPQPCCGGYVDWQRGKYVQTWRCITLTGQEAFRRYGGLQGRYFACGLTVASRHGNSLKGTMANMGKLANPYENGTVDAVWVLMDSNTAVLRIGLSDASIDTPDEFKAHLAALYNAGTPFTVAYEMMEPLEYDISLAPLTALAGATVMFSDAGTTQATYHANVAYLLEQCEARIAALEAAKAGA